MTIKESLNIAKAAVRIREKGEIPLLLGRGIAATLVRMTNIDPKKKSLFLPAGKGARSGEMTPYFSR
jgi:hypothetical protein